MSAGDALANRESVRVPEEQVCCSAFVLLHEGRYGSDVTLTLNLEKQVVKLYFSSTGPRFLTGHTPHDLRAE
jgi:hypothetical protein